jgi:hypothetical protein
LASTSDNVATLAGLTEYDRLFKEVGKRPNWSEAAKRLGDLNDPEEFDRLFDGALAEWIRDPAQSLLVTYFPLAVVKRLRASSVPGPVLFFEHLKHLESDPDAEKSFNHDLFRLLADEDRFDRPTNDLGRCLALAVFEDHARERLAGNGHELKMLDDTDSGACCARQRRSFIMCSTFLIFGLDASLLRHSEA